MVKHCQKCGKTFETMDKDINFCDECQYEESKWDEFFDTIKKRQSMTKKE